MVKNLLNEISSITDVDAAVLLRVPPINSNEYLEVQQAAPPQAFRDYFEPVSLQQHSDCVTIDHDLLQVIKSQSAIYSSINSDVKTKAFFPITTNKLVSVLCVFGKQLSAETTDALTLLSAIYSNFLRVIDDGERDSLTQLLNRKTFDLQLTQLLNESKSNPTPRINKERRAAQSESFHWIAILDIDHFKSINDNYGHMYGDEVLLLFSNMMRESFRSSDLLFRYGGEEFVVVLAPTTEESATMIFERFRNKLAAFRFPQVSNVTASIGMVMMSNEHHTTTLLDHADQALYYAKQHGRNQVCNYSQLIDQGLLEEVDILNDVEMF